MILIIVAVFLSVFAVAEYSDVSVADSDGNDGNIHWTISGDTLTLEKGSGADSGEMRDWTSIDTKPENYPSAARPAWEYGAGWSSVTNIVMKSGITNVGEYAFYGFSALKSVIIPDSVTSIGEGAFQNCSSLLSVIIPDSVSSIGKWAFKNCSSLSSSTIGASVTHIGTEAFSECFSMHVVYYNAPDPAGYAKYWPVTKMMIIDAQGGHVEGGALSNNEFPSADSFRPPAGKVFKEYNNAMSGYGSSFQPGSRLSFDGRIIMYAMWAPAIKITFDSNGGTPDRTTMVTDEKLKAFPDDPTRDGYLLLGWYTSATGGAKITLDTVFTRNTTVYAHWSNAEGDDGNIHWTISGDTLTLEKRPGAESGKMRGWTSMYDRIKNKPEADRPAWEEGVGWSNVTNVVIKDGITSVGDYAFHMSNISSVIFPDSVTTIGRGAFQQCLGIVNFTIPDSVTTIGPAAFDSCESLTSIVIPDSVTSIQGFAFWGCESLTSATIGAGVESIGEWAFDSCRALHTIYYNAARLGSTHAYWQGPWTDTYILFINANGGYVTGDAMIDGKMPSAEHFVPPAGMGLKEYNTRADGKGTSYKPGDKCGLKDNPVLYAVWAPVCTVTFDSNGGTPARMTEITDTDGKLKVFPDDPTKDGCFLIGWYTSPSGGTEITPRTVFRQDTTVYAQWAEPEGVEWDIHWSISGDTLTLERAEGHDAGRMRPYEETYPRPAWESGYGWSNVTKVEVLDSVTAIQTYAFYGCSTIESVHIGKSVDAIEYAAFKNCTSLTSVTIDGEIVIYGYYAFDGTALNTVYCNTSVLDKTGSFWSGNDILFIEANGGYVTGDGMDPNDKRFPDAGDYVSPEGKEFRCYKTTRDGTGTIYMPGEQYKLGGRQVVYAQWRENYSSNEGREGNIVWSISGDTLTLKKAEEARSGSMERYDPWGRPAWDRGSSMINVTKVVIKNGVTSIGDYAFYGCPVLRSVTIPESVTTIAYAAFQNCPSLLSVDIPDSVTTIGDFAFNNCGSLSSVVIGAGVTTIKDKAFLNCSSLSSVVIGAGVTRIGTDVFSECASLHVVYCNASDLDVSAGYWPDTKILFIEANGGYVGGVGMANDKFPSADGFYPPVGMVFKGYNAKTDGTGTSYSPGSWCYLEGNRNVVYAQWAERSDDTTNYTRGDDGNIRWTISGDTLILEKARGEDCGRMEDYDGSHRPQWEDGDGWSNVTKVVIREPVDYIGAYAFVSGDFESVVIPDSVTAIGPKAFSDCTNLESVVIPDSVTSIGSGAFGFCTLLHLIYYNASDLDPSGDCWPARKVVFIEANGGYVAGGPTMFPSFPTGEDFVPPAGKVLMGYNTEKDGSGTAYQPGQRHNIKVNTVVYAIWTKAPAGTFGSAGATPLVPEATGFDGNLMKSPEGPSMGDRASVGCHTAISDGTIAFDIVFAENIKVSVQWSIWPIPMSLLGMMAAYIW